ncbi:cobaltochelatase subunit CobN [Ascidiaceihabitans sp.]|nr:cobaltochelatase subunit CobN [Ascidiaceihabitans sp.]
MAVHLLGVKPVWDEGSERVSGIEIIPITELERPSPDCMGRKAPGHQPLISGPLTTTVPIQRQSNCAACSISQRHVAR